MDANHPDVYTVAYTIAMAAVLFFQFLQHQKTARTEQIVNKTNHVVEEVKSEVKEVKKVVDGPLSVALESNAVLTKRIHELSGLPEDAEAASKAQTLVENRQLGKAERVSTGIDKDTV